MTYAKPPNKQTPKPNGTEGADFYFLAEMYNEKFSATPCCGHSHLLLITPPQGSLLEVAQQSFRLLIALYSVYAPLSTVTNEL